MSMIAFLMGAHLVIPTLFQDGGNFSTLAASSFRDTDSYRVTNHVLNVYIYQDRNMKEFHSQYQPPNYGGPDSEYGSGTR
jgi:hypothetical protein